MLVGLPITNIIDQVFAAVNSAIKNGIGEILVLLQKKQINGVKVKITISLEVNTVRNATRKYIRYSIKNMRKLKKSFLHDIKNMKREMSSCRI